jgi:iron complex outermembrane receptor protein
VPTDFEYVGLKTEFGKGWYMEVKPYTYNYDNTEPFANNTPMTENDSLATVPGSYIDPKIAAPTVLGTTLTKNLAYNGVAVAPCNLMVVKSGLAALPCGVDKYNSYRKYGETSVLTQTSKYGVFRTGLWYEWARTNRHQYPSDPLNNWTDQPLPNFDESFWTNSFQPYAEYEYHLTKQLNVTGGVKYAGYTFDILHRADNGKTVGPLTCYVAGVVPTAACAATITDTGSFTAWLPSFDMNYRIKSDWSIYAQVATGSIVPPSNVYDYNHTVSATNPTPGLLTPPKQQKSTTYQGGSVYKGNEITLDADAYYIQFDNSYSSVTDPSTSEQVFYLQPGSISKGIEFESNFVLSHGLSFYLNATAGNATYSGTANANTTATQLTAPYMVTAPTGLWVAMTPADTEASGITYNSHGLDLGFYTKRVGEMRVDNGSYHNQNIINPFDVTSCYANYTVRNHSLFDQTKFRLSINNLLNQNNLVSETLTGTKNTQLIAGTSFTDPFTTTAATAPAAGDTVGFLSGRSVTFSVTFGFAPGNRKK